MGANSSAEWYVKWCEPIVVALYERDSAKLGEVIGAAHAALKSGKLSDVSAACLKYQLAYLESQSCTALRESGWKEKLLILAEQLAEPSEVSVAERLRLRLYIQARTSLDRVSVLGLPPEEFEDLIDGLPVEEHTTELWHHISGWSFLHEQADYLAKAYEFAVTQARGFNVEWTWHRVNVMWRMVSGNAERSDIAWLLEKVEIPQQLRSIKRDIWPRARTMGLVDGELEEKLLEAEYELNVQPEGRVLSLLGPHLSGRPDGQISSPAGQAV